MPISPEAQHALDTAEKWAKQVGSVPRQEDKANLLQQTQLLLLRALLQEVAELRSEMSKRDA